MSRTTDSGKARIGIYSLTAFTQSPIPQYEFDLTDFRDPMGSKVLGGCVDGRDEKVKEWIKVDPRFQPILNQVLIIVKDSLDAGKGGWISIGFRDYHGKWKARAVAELVADTLQVDYPVAVIHAAI